jgi:hypothetical protein
MINILFWILLIPLCVSNIIMVVLFYKHDAELDRQNIKIDELLALHGMLPQAKAERHLHRG